jgi:hypothetical protein
MQRKTKKMVPIIITMDLEVAYDYNLNEQKIILGKLCNDFKKIGFPMTIFSTSEAVDKFPEQIKIMHSLNHEIGCHGLNHNKDENYKKMPEVKICNNIITSGIKIQNLISKKPVCFRGPGMSTSRETQKVLIENGYMADFSVCSQRLDFFNSKGGDIRWLFSPRLPYNPSSKSPFKKGNLPLWVIPLSSVGLPFISGILYLFGLRFMKLFFKLLLKEAIKTNKPIVYLFHSYEFTRYIDSVNDTGREDDGNKHKKKLIHKLYLQNPASRYKLNFVLIKYMLAHNGLKPMTANEYCKRLERRNI